MSADDPAGGRLAQVYTFYTPNPSGIAITGESTYTLSCYLKASRPGLRALVRALVVGIGKEDRSVAVSSEWQRYTLSFSTKGRSSVRVVPHVYILDPGTLWVDAVQLEKGDTPSDYVADAELEEHADLLQLPLH